MHPFYSLRSTSLKELQKTARNAFHVALHKMGREDGMAIVCAESLVEATDDPAAAIGAIIDMIQQSEEVTEEQKESIAEMLRSRGGGGDTSVVGAILKLRGERSLDVIREDEETQGIVKEAGTQLLDCADAETRAAVWSKILEGQLPTEPLQMALDAAGRLDEDARVSFIQRLLSESTEGVRERACEGQAPGKEHLEALQEALEVQAAASVEKVKKAAAQLEVSMSAARKALKKATGGLQCLFFPSTFPFS